MGMIKSFEHYVSNSAKKDSNSLAQRLVEYDIDSASALYQSLGAYLQDAMVTQARQNVKEILEMEN